MAHKSSKIDTADTSKKSLLAAMQWEALLCSAVACKISKQRELTGITQTSLQNWTIHT